MNENIITLGLAESPNHFLLFGFIPGAPVTGSYITLGTSEHITQYLLLGMGISVIPPPSGVTGQPAILWRIGFKSIQTKIAFIGGTIPEIDK